jgi:hypothetical protein
MEGVPCQGLVYKGRDNARKFSVEKKLRLLGGWVKQVGQRRGAVVIV